MLENIELETAPNPQANPFNFLDTPAPAPAPQAAPTSSAFNFLDSAPPAPAPAASSAFTFMSNATPAPAPAPAPLGGGSGLLNKSSSFKAAPAGQTELEKMLANSSGYLPSMTARPASNAFEMEFGYGQVQQQPMQNAYMQQQYTQQQYMQQQQQFSSAVRISLLFLCFVYSPVPAAGHAAHLRLCRGCYEGSSQELKASFLFIVIQIQVNAERS